MVAEFNFIDVWFKEQNKFRGKIFNGFKFEVEGMAGSVYLYNGELTIYCSPFWNFTEQETDEGINVLYFKDDELVDSFTIEYSIPKNYIEYNQFIEFYTEKLNEISKNILI
jgi:hypothetical protein